MENHGENDDDGSVLPRRVEVEEVFEVYDEWEDEPVPGNGWDEFSDLNDEALRQLKSNDPALTHLYISSDDYRFFKVDWETEGHFLAKNTQLTSVVFKDCGEIVMIIRRDTKAHEDVWNYPLYCLLEALAKNTSVESLMFFKCRFNSTASQLDELEDFFELNGNLQRFEMIYCSMTSDHVSSIVSALEQGESLEHVRFKNNSYSPLDNANDICMGKILASLGGHTNLKTISLRRNGLHWNTTYALGNLLQNNCVQD